MKLSLWPAVDNDLEFCESLNRRNMGGYLAARGSLWDRSRFLASWSEFENLLIISESDVTGLLRLAPELDALGLRDLQVAPEHQRRGIGTWAIQEAQLITAKRGFRRLQLRVYEENPAMTLYARLGFAVESVLGGTVHMVWAVPPNNSFKSKTLRVST